MASDYSVAEAQRLSQARRQSTQSIRTQCFMLRRDCTGSGAQSRAAPSVSALEVPFVMSGFICMFSGGKLHKHLRQGKHPYRKDYGTKCSSIPDAVSIELSPAVVDERSCLGDWEADLVLGVQETGSIVTLAERKSRIYLIKNCYSKMPEKSAEPLSRY
ncbi:Transposase and inactivated derivatives, IS30 family [Plesiomonas shigelloides]|nr:Transposase and inactivated derivatives, IS30 family [Plesiomonas shigelloides]